jgi:hypothetical protein
MIWNGVNRIKPATGIIAGHSHITVKVLVCPVFNFAREVIPFLRAALKAPGNVLRPKICAWPNEAGS